MGAAMGAASDLPGLTSSAAAGAMAKIAAMKSKATGSMRWVMGLPLEWSF
jgi:hypothetical protein